MDNGVPIITLLTDFGLEDEYVGVIKGVILSINPRARIVDLTHNIPRHDITQAALAIRAAFAYFPEGTIHVIVVDPGVGGRRKVLCLKKGGHLFLAPDNGVLSLVMGQDKGMDVWEVTSEAYFLTPTSHTFHGRDVFAPVAAHLSAGLDTFRLGPRLAVEDVHKADIPWARVSQENVLEGRIVSVDHFGNLVTNIDQEAFDAFCHPYRGQEVVITLGKHTIRGTSESYEAVPVGAPAALFGSRGLLEIVVNQGDARTYFSAGVGHEVRLSL